tara:strand:- start:195 stop:1106 length:912 start_codon:yes stop_codon:yes gene_type:complete
MTIGQAGFGLYQTIKGAKDAKDNVRPTYEIPQSMLDAMDDAERMAIRGLPEQTRQNFLQGMVDTRAASFEGLSDRKAGIGAVAGVQQREIAGQQQLAQMDAEQRMRNISALQQMRQQMAQFEDREFDINEMQPYQDRAAAASALQGAGLQNIFGAAETYAKMEMSGYNQQQRDIRDMKRELKSEYKAEAAKGLAPGEKAPNFRKIEIGGKTFRDSFREKKGEMNRAFYQGLNNPYAQFMDNSSQNNSFFSNDPAIQNGLNNSTFNSLSEGVQRMLTDMGYTPEQLAQMSQLQIQNIIQSNMAM